MISLESEVLQRHLPLFSGKSILLAGGINDDFPQILQKHCQSVQVWSWYFDYAKTQSAVNFEDVLPTQLEEKEIIPEARRYPPEIDLFASEGFLQFFFEDNVDDSFNVYLLDEKNRLEIYRQCEGSKDDKVREINQIYQSLGSKDCENPYKMVQRNFNYPQFYQLHPTESGMRIMPFKFKSKRTCE